MTPLQRVLAGAIAAALSSSAALGANILFREDFSEPSLQPGWTIIRPDPDTYSLTAVPGFFRILTVRGLLGADGTAKNLVVRPISGDFILDARVEFNPRDGQPFAGLLVYQDDAHAVSVGLVYVSGERGVFRGVVMLNVGENVDATNRPASKYDESNTEQPDIIFLRLLRRGDQFVGAYSADGISYRELGTVTNALPSQISVGFGAANGDSEACGPACDVPIPAAFDYFQISELDVGDGGSTGQPVLQSLEIQGPEEVATGATETFQAIAHFDDDTLQDVSDLAEWTVAPPDVGTVENGIFRASGSNADRMGTIVATYTQQSGTGNITLTQAVLVRVRSNNVTGMGRLCGAGFVGLFPVFCLPLVWRRRSIDIGGSPSRKMPKEQDSRPQGRWPHSQKSVTSDYGSFRLTETAKIVK